MPRYSGNRRCGAHAAPQCAHPRSGGCSSVEGCASLSGTSTRTLRSACRTIIPRVWASARPPSASEGARQTAVLCCRRPALGQRTRAPLPATSALTGTQPPVTGSSPSRARTRRRATAHQYHPDRESLVWARAALCQTLTGCETVYNLHSVSQPT